MKKLFSLILAAAMLFAAVSVSALPVEEKDADVKPPYLEGYVISNKNGAALYEWVGFSAGDPANIDIYDSMDLTFAAAYYNGYVYGYLYGYDGEGVLHTEFYRMNAGTHVVEFIGGASAGGEFVFGMAYNYVDNTMYALVDEYDPYIASVDLATGALTRVVTLDQSGVINLGVHCFAIDGEGNFLVLSLSSLNARLVKIDPATGVGAELFATGYDSFFGQSMTYRHADNCIYWAQADQSGHGTLVVLDLTTNTVTNNGTIGTDLELMGLYIAEDPEGTIPQPATYTVTFVDWDGTVLSTQTVVEGEAASAPADPEREGYTFIGWDTEFTHVYSDLTVTALYEQNETPSEYLKGDVNCDGIVDSADITLAAAYAMSAGEVTPQGVINGDMNGDGLLTAADLSALYSFIQG